ncbi:MAG: hypothetical protein WAM05_09800 [Candidatus Binataceae bacterium]
MNRIISVVCGLAVLLLFAASADADPTMDLATIDWSVNAPRSLAKISPSTETVLALARKLQPEGETAFTDLCGEPMFANLRFRPNRCFTGCTSSVLPTLSHEQQNAHRGYVFFGLVTLNTDPG